MSLSVAPPEVSQASTPLALDERRLAGELARIGGAGLVVVVMLAALLAHDHRFIGSIDNEEIFAQGHALLQVWARSDSISTRAFLDIATPFTYSPALHAFTLPLLALSHVTPPWFAFNLLALTTLLVNGLAMYGFLRAVGRSRAAAAMGGVMFALSPTVLMYWFVDAYLGQAFFLPITLYLVLRDRLLGFRPGNWAIFGGCVALMSGAHEYLGLMGVGLLASALACNARRLGWRALIEAAVSAAAAFLVLMAPVLWMYVQQHRFDVATQTVFTRPLEHSIEGSCDLLDYLLPTAQHQLLAWFSPYVQPSHWDGVVAWLGVINLGTLAVLAFWGVLRREKMRDFLDASPALRVLRAELLVWGMGMVVLTLGPRWKAFPSIALPVELLRLIPPFQMVRGWGRFAMGGFFVATILSAHLIDRALRSAAARDPHRPSSRAAVIAIMLLALAIVDQVPVVYDPTFRVSLPTALEAIKNEPGDFLVMHLPLSWGTGPLHNGVAQVLQAFHGKRTVNGYNAFLPERYLETLVQTPLRPLVLCAPAGAPVPPDALGLWLVERDVRFIVYEHHTQDYWPPRFSEREDVRHRIDTTRLLAGLQTRGWLSVIEHDDDYTVYRVEP